MEGDVPASTHPYITNRTEQDVQTNRMNESRLGFLLIHAGIEQFIHAIV